VRNVGYRFVPVKAERAERAERGSEERARNARELGAHAGVSAR
jgi:hypothetical protein